MGEMILRAEENPKGVSYLVRGYVRMYTLTPSGETVVFHMFRPGAFFPMMWVLSGEENRYYFDAATAVETYRAPKEQVLAFLAVHPDVHLDLTKRLLAGMKGLLSRLESLLLDAAYTKTALLLLYFAQVFGEETSEGVTLRIPVAHREIASWIGTTRETVSLQVETLKRKGIVKNRGRQIIVPNMQRLEQEIVATRNALLV